MVITAQTASCNKTLIPEKVAFQKVLENVNAKLNTHGKKEIPNDRKVNLYI